MITLNIEFTSPKKSNPFSWLIRRIQGTKYSHVRLSWVNSTQTHIIYEASGSHIKFIGPLAAKDNPVTIHDSFYFDLTNDQYRELVKICMTYAGLKYSFKQVINIGLANLGFRWRPFKSKLEYTQVCSEVVIRVLQTLGIHVNIDPEMSGPKELNQVLKQLKY